uniref:DUF4355 domain-containing protein n=1 Tax=uncultured Clostridium sp. TaxID=59620 RepID=UPI00272F81DA
AGAGVNGAGNTNNSDAINQNESNSNEQNQIEKTFTQEDVDKIIQDRLATEQSKWEKRVQDEKTEAEKMAKMNSEQKAKYEEEKRNADLERREKEITVRELKATAYEILAKKDLPKELVDILNYSNAEECNKSIETVEKTFQSAVEKVVNERLRGTNIPTGSGLGGASPKGFGFSFTGVRNKK